MPNHGAPVRRRLKRIFVLVPSLMVASLVISMPAAHADDPFCALFVSDHAVNIDFGQPLDQIRLSATQVVPIVAAIRKGLPADAPGSVRTFYAELSPLVGQATHVDTIEHARHLATKLVALNGSPAGKSAAAWTAKLCPTALDVADATASDPTQTPHGAGAPPPASRAGGRLDPCSVIAQHDAAAALDADPGPGTSTPEPWGGQCSYETETGGIILNVLKGDLKGKALGGKAAFEKTEASAQAQAAKDTKGRVTYRTVSGIGDGCFVVGGGPMASLVFYTGDTSVTILLSFTNMGTPTPIGQATSLARAVAARMPR